MMSLRTRSFLRYRMHGDLPSPYGEDFAARLTARRFLPLQAGQERTFGWVSAENLLVTEFLPGSLLCGEYATFALRVDRRRVNPRLLRAQVDLEVKARLDAAEDAGGPRRLARGERRAMREEIHQELLRQTQPSVDAHTVMLHPKQKILYVLGLARLANELVQAHFRDTFEAELTALDPWQRAVELVQDEARRGADLGPALADLRRTEFARAGVGAAVGMRS
jgi:DNA recombination-dependent growth factor C